MKRKRSKLFQNILNDFIESEKNGCKAIAFDELVYKYHSWLDDIKTVCYRIRRYRQKSQGIPLIREWTKGKGKRRYCSGLKPCDGSAEDIARLKADIAIDRNQVIGRFLSLDERLLNAVEMKMLKPREHKKYLLLSDSRSH